MTKYGTPLLIAVLFLLVGLVLWGLGDDNVAQSGMWLSILSGGGVTFIALFWVDDCRQANRAVPQRRR